MYTMKNWEADGDLRVSKGMLVSNDVILELLDCLPPAYMCRGIFQVGEPYDHDEEGKPLYSTFVKKCEGWECMGICREGETTEREGICSKYLK